MNEGAIVHTWGAPRMATRDGTLIWRAECYCGDAVTGDEPAGVIAAMQKHEDR